MTLQTLLISLIVIWVSAKLLGELAERLKLPAVLGEILAGAIVGSHALGLVPQHEFLQLLAEVGVIVLLFEVGLQTDLIGLLRVGPKSLVVALVGVALPMASGYLLGLVFHLSFSAALLVGAALSATSIAISSRTLSDLGALESEEGRIVLGAAVLDDVLGLMILSVVVAVVSGQAATPLFIGMTTLRAVLFIVVALVGGHLLAKPLLRLVDSMTVRGALVVAALVFAMVFALLSDRAGLAPIIGAFAAGVVLARTHRAKFIEERLRPIASIFIPIFFVSVGASVDFTALSPVTPQGRLMLLFTAAIIVVAFAGKLACGLGAWGKGMRRGLIGMAMVPRGEVGLVFAQVGLTRGVLDSQTAAVVVIMVFVTALVTPLGLSLMLRRRPPGEGDRE